MIEQLKQNASASALRFVPRTSEKSVIEMRQRLVHEIEQVRADGEARGPKFAAATATAEKKCAELTQALAAAQTEATRAGSAWQAFSLSVERAIEVARQELAASADPVIAETIGAVRSEIDMLIGRSTDGTGRSTFSTSTASLERHADINARVAWLRAAADRLDQLRYEALSAEDLRTAIEDVLSPTVDRKRARA